MTPSISRVTVEDDGIDRTTTIVIGEGRRANDYTALVESLPPRIRDYLREWLGAAEISAAGGGPDGHEPADDVQGVGFRVAPEVTARRQ